MGRKSGPGGRICDYSGARRLGPFGPFRTVQQAFARNSAREKVSASYDWW